MFWKKKKQQTDTFIYESKDKRDAYRYDFKDGQGFEIQFKGKTLQVINISAGGIAFYNSDFEQFDSDFVKFKLDIPNFKDDTSFYTGLRILTIDETNICHCIFEQCSLEQHELIHKYVLEMQKDDLAH
ncbi:MAG: PilZ domain-containing protein [Desulfobacteraceae bacterium]|nr:PilZ domain-containing protein [Desulfobacteraceae bacterium]